MWLQHLRELQQATEAIVRDESVGYLELIKMRVELRQLHTLIQHHIDKRLMKEEEKENG